MNTITAKIDRLAFQIDNLIHSQEKHLKEVRRISRELKNLSEEWKTAPDKKEEPVAVTPPVAPLAQTLPPPTEPPKPIPPKAKPLTPPLKAEAVPTQKKPSKKRSAKNLEAYVGGNLISKIGIALTVLGLGYFLKYAIDRDLISPVFRILLALFAGGGLIGVAARLKNKYPGYSGVLFSGGITTLYFSIFGAHDFFGLIPYGLAHILMVATTALAVYAAFQYKVEAIAIIGMVGSYAIRFLLNGDYGNPWAFFSYIALINGGILSLAVFRFWRVTYYLSFFCTWLIFAIWVGLNTTADFFPLGLLFATVSFLTFYAVFLGYKLYHKEALKGLDIGYVLLNAGIYFGLGHVLISRIPGGEHFLGTFSLANALLHAGVAWIIYRSRPVAKEVRFLAIGLAWIFITLAIPIQLGRAWVPMLWIMEAFVLFAIARYQKVFFYERLSYLMIVFALISLAISWEVELVNYFSPDFQNIHIEYGWEGMTWLNKKVMATLMVASGLGALIYLHHLRPSPYPKKYQVQNGHTFGTVLPVLMLGVIFWGGFWEIIHYQFDQFLQHQQVASVHLIPILLAIFSLALFSLAAYLNLSWAQRSSYGLIIFLFSMFTWVLLFGIVGNEFSELRNLLLSEAHQVPRYFVWMRYPTAALLLLSLYLNFRQIQRFENLQPLARIFTIFTLGVGLYLLSLEVLHWGWLHEFRVGSGSEEIIGKYRRVGLSVLWGSYGLGLMILGFWRKEILLRVFAIVLMAATLLKIFFYDMQDISNVNKTINFVALGIVMLIVSYLYQRYKHLIHGEEEE